MGLVTVSVGGSEFGRTVEEDGRPLNLNHSGQDYLHNLTYIITHTHISTDLPMYQQQASDIPVFKETPKRGHVTIRSRRLAIEENLQQSGLLGLVEGWLWFLLLAFSATAGITILLLMLPLMPAS